MKQIQQIVKEKDRLYTNQCGEKRRKPNDAIRNAAEVIVKLSEMCRQARLRQWRHFKRLPPTSTISKALGGEAPIDSGQKVKQKRSWLQLLEEDISTRQNPETGNPLTIKGAEDFSRDGSKFRKYVVYGTRTDGEHISHGV
jgi:hypothetical protein